VSLDQMRHFWQEALTQSKDAAIGLHAGVRPPRGRYGLFDYIVAYSPTIGDALTRFGDYLPLINNWAPELVRFEFPEPGPTEPPDEHARVLRCDTEFGAPRTEFIISRETWDQPVRSADAGLVGLLEQQAVDLWHNSQAPPRS
jgi:Arabinose-binding domain of AraC transcription regulator, N-term